jgi:hypothetical protein
MPFMQKLNPHGVRFYYSALGINIIVLPIRYGGSPTESKTLVLFDFWTSSCDHDRAYGYDSVFVRYLLLNAELSNVMVYVYLGASVDMLCHDSIPRFSMIHPPSRPIASLNFVNATY